MIQGWNNVPPIYLLGMVSDGKEENGQCTRYTKGQRTYKVCSRINMYVQLCPMDIVHVVDTERGRGVLRKCNDKQAMYSGKLAWCISCHCYDARWTFISTAKCNAQSSTGIASLPDSTKVQRF